MPSTNVVTSPREDRPLGPLALAPDGASFEGAYAVTLVPPGASADLLEGTWQGTRH